MIEPVDKHPHRKISKILKLIGLVIGVVGLILALFMAGYNMGTSIQSSEASKLKNECDRKEKALDNTIDQYNIVKLAFDKYRRQYPGLTDGELSEENNKLKIEFQLEINKNQDLSDQLSAKNEELKNTKNDLQNAVVKMKNNDENLDKIKKLTDELNKKDSELEIAKNTIKELDLKSSKIDSQKDQLEKYLRETDAKVREMQNQKDQLEKNLKGADAKVKELQNIKEDLDRKLKEAPLQLSKTYGNVGQTTRQPFGINSQAKKLETCQQNAETIMIWSRQKGLAFRGALLIRVTDIKNDKVFLIIGSPGHPNLTKAENIGNTFTYNSNASYEIKIVKINQSKLVEFYITQKLKFKN